VIGGGDHCKVIVSKKMYTHVYNMMHIHARQRIFATAVHTRHAVRGIECTHMHICTYFTCVCTHAPFCTHTRTHTLLHTYTQRSPYLRRLCANDMLWEELDVSWDTFAPDPICNIMTGTNAYVSMECTHICTHYTHVHTLTHTHLTQSAISW